MAVTSGLSLSPGINVKPVRSLWTPSWPLLMGLVAFVFLMMRTTYGKFTPAQATSAIVVSYYWHFVDIVWIGLFTIIYLIK